MKPIKKIFGRLNLHERYFVFFQKYLGRFVTSVFRMAEDAPKADASQNEAMNENEPKSAEENKEVVEDETKKPVAASEGNESTGQDEKDPEQKETENPTGILLCSSYILSHSILFILFHSHPFHSILPYCNSSFYFICILFYLHLVSNFHACGI